MSTVLNTLKHPIDLAGGQQVGAGAVKSGVDITNTFNALLVSTGILRVLTEPYTTTSSTPTPWVPEETAVIILGDTAANFTAANPILTRGEIGLELGTGLMKHGDNVTPWNTLAYITGAGGAPGSPIDGGTP